MSMLDELRAGLARFSDYAPAGSATVRAFVRSTGSPIVAACDGLDQLEAPPGRLVLIHSGRWRVVVEGEAPGAAEPGQVLRASPVPRWFEPETSGDWASVIFILESPDDSGPLPPETWIDTDGGDYVLRSAYLSGPEPDLAARLVFAPEGDGGSASDASCTSETDSLAKVCLTPGASRRTAGHVETLIVQAGSVEVICEDAVLTLGPGDVFRTPARRRLHLQNPWSVPAEVFAWRTA